MSPRPENAENDDDVDSFLHEMIHEDYNQLHEVMRRLNLARAWLRERNYSSRPQEPTNEDGNEDTPNREDTEQDVSTEATESSVAQEMLPDPITHLDIALLPWDCQLQIFSWVPNLLTMAAVNRFYFKNILHSLRDLTLMRYSCFEPRKSNVSVTDNIHFAHKSSQTRTKTGTVVINILNNSFSLQNVHHNLYIAPHSVFESLQSQTLALSDVSTEFYFDLWSEEYSTRVNQEDCSVLETLWKEISSDALRPLMDPDEFHDSRASISPKNRTLQEGYLFHGSWVSIKRCRDDKLVCCQESNVSANTDPASRNIVLLSQANLKKNRNTSGKWRVYFLDGGLLHSRSKFCLLSENGAVLLGSDHFVKMGFRDVHHTLCGQMCSDQAQQRGPLHDLPLRLTLSNLLHDTAIGDRVLWKLDEIENQLMYRNKKRLAYDIGV